MDGNFFYNAGLDVGQQRLAGVLPLVRVFFRRPRIVLRLIRRRLFIHVSYSTPKNSLVNGTTIEIGLLLSWIILALQKMPLVIFLLRPFFEVQL